MELVIVVVGMILLGPLFWVIEAVASLIWVIACVIAGVNPVTYEKVDKE